MYKNQAGVHGQNVEGSCDEVAYDRFFSSFFLFTYIVM
jgi:hypothetical protein